MLFSVTFGQNKKEVTKEEKIYNQNELDETAHYIDGKDLLYAKIYRNYKNPTALEKNDITRCSIAISFTIEKNGKISNLKSIRDCGLGSGEEAIRVLKSIKGWKPGRIKNKAVRSSYIISIHLRNLE